MTGAPPSTVIGIACAVLTQFVTGNSDAAAIVGMAGSALAFMVASVVHVQRRENRR